MRVADIVVGPRQRRELGDIEALAVSIAGVGLLQPVVVTPEGGLVAGRRRLEAVRHLGWVRLPVHVVKGFDEAAALLRAERDENVCRKPFTPSEAVALGAALEALERQAARDRQQQGRRRGGRARHGPAVRSGANCHQADRARTRDKVGAVVGLSGRTYEQARAVVEAAEAAPEKYGPLRERMDRSGKVYGVYRQLLILQHAARLEQEPPGPLPAGPFQVLVADPPWQHEADHPCAMGTPLYPTMPLADIKELPVTGLASPDALLWLWVPTPLLPAGLEVMAEWGFSYKTALTWVKSSPGLGRLLRGQAEQCLLGVRGRPLVVLRNQTTALLAPRREHSRKPDEFYKLVEGLCPGSKVELFARQRRPGWQVWGADLDHFPQQVEGQDEGDRPATAREGQAQGRRRKGKSRG